MHVAVHALRGRDRPGEDVADRVAALAHAAMIGVGRRGGRPQLLAAAGCPSRRRRRGWRRPARPAAGLPWPSPPVAWPASAPCPSRWVRREIVGSTVAGLAVAAEAGVGQAVPRLAVVGVDDVAAGAAGVAIVARLVVGAHEPHERVVEPGLVDVEDRDRDAKAGAGAAVRLADVGPARLLEPLDAAGRVGQADLGELGVDVAAAALEHAEDVARRHDVPGRQRIELGEHAARLLRLAERRRRSATGSAPARRSRV